MWPDILLRGRCLIGILALALYLFLEAPALALYLFLEDPALALYLFLKVPAFAGMTVWNIIISYGFYIGRHPRAGGDLQEPGEFSLIV